MHVHSYTLYIQTSTCFPMNSCVPLKVAFLNQDHSGNIITPTCWAAQKSNALYVKTANTKTNHALLTPTPCGKETVSNYIIEDIATEIVCYNMHAGIHIINTKERVENLHKVIVDHAWFS